MKKQIALLLALVLLAAMLCSCGGAKQNEETTTEPTTTEAPLVWNEELQNKIKQTRVDWLQNEENKKEATLENVKIERYYGIYNGAVAVMMSDSFHDYTMMEFPVEIDGVVFWYRHGNTIMVWKNNAFYTLQESVNQGFLTHGDLVQIADIQNNNGGYFNQ